MMEILSSLWPAVGLGVLASMAIQSTVVLIALHNAIWREKSKDKYRGDTVFEYRKMALKYVAFLYADCILFAWLLWRYL